MHASRSRGSVAARVLPRRAGPCPSGTSTPNSERVRESVQDVERHVGRGRPARPPGEAARLRLRLAELRERRVALGLRDPRIEDARRARRPVLAAPRRLEPRRLLEGHPAVRVRRRPRSRAACRASTAPAPSPRPPGSRGRPTTRSRRDEAVERLLGALVGVVHEVRQRREHRVEELAVDGDDELLVDARSGRRVFAMSANVSVRRSPPAQRGEARLRELHPARQHRHRPQLAVREARRRPPSP